MTRRPKLTLSSPPKETKKPASRLNAAAASKPKPQTPDADVQANGRSASKGAGSSDHGATRVPSVPTIAKALIAVAAVVASILLLRQRLF